MSNDSPITTNVVESEGTVLFARKGLNSQTCSLAQFHSSNYSFSHSFPYIPSLPNGVSYQFMLRRWIALQPSYLNLKLYLQKVRLFILNAPQLI